MWVLCKPNPDADMAGSRSQGCQQPSPGRPTACRSAMLLNLVLIDQIPLLCRRTRWGRAAAPLLTAPQHILARHSQGRMLERGRAPRLYLRASGSLDIPHPAEKPPDTLAHPTCLLLLPRQQKQESAPGTSDYLLCDPVIDGPPAPLPLAVGPGSITKRAACPITSHPIPSHSIPFHPIPHPTAHPHPQHNTVHAMPWGRRVPAQLHASFPELYGKKMWLPCSGGLSLGSLLALPMVQARCGWIYSQGGSREGCHPSPAARGYPEVSETCIPPCPQNPTASSPGPSQIQHRGERTARGTALPQTH